MEGRRDEGREGWRGGGTQRWKDTRLEGWTFMRTRGCEDSARRTQTGCDGMWTT